MKKSIMAALSVAVIGAAGSAANANIIFGGSHTYPDVSSNLTSSNAGITSAGPTNYDFTVSGFTTSITATNGGSPTSIIPFGNFTMDAHFTVSGGIVSVTSGDLTVTDGTPTTLFSSSTLLDAGVESSTQFDFLFSGGSGTQLTAGDKIGVILTSTGPGRTTGFTNTFDVPAVPEPATLSVAGIGALAMLVRRRRRSAV